MHLAFLMKRCNFFHSILTSEPQAGEFLGAAASSAMFVAAGARRSRLLLLTSRAAEESALPGWQAAAAAARIRSWCSQAPRWRGRQAPRGGNWRDREGESREGKRKREKGEESEKGEMQ